MVQFSNFLCTINIGGLPLKEYINADDCVAPLEGFPPTKIVYIQSEEGRRFSIGFRAIDNIGIVPANSVVINLELDGFPIGGGIISYIPGGGNVIRSNCYMDGEGRWLQRDFIFSKLDVREDGPNQDLNIDTSRLGEITLRIRRYHARIDSSRPSSGDGFGDLQKTDPLHEKQLKGRDISHTIGLSAPTAAATPNAIFGQYLDNEHSPYAVIKFRYRSESGLKSLGLIPRTPLPSLSPEPVKGMSREDLEAEVARLRASQIKIKSEKTGVKRERPCTFAGPSTAPKKRKHIVIDLTEDSD